MRIGVMRPFFLIAAVTIIVSCGVESTDGLHGPAFVAEAPSDLSSEELCSLFADLPDGEPLDGLELGSDREAAVRSAMAGRMPDRQALASAYDELIASIEAYAVAFESADSLLNTDGPQPVAVAALDWRAFHRAIVDQRELTDEVIETVLALADRGEQVTEAPEYVSVARSWAEAQVGVNLIASQIQWSHHRGVAYLESACGELPDFSLEESGSG